MKKFVTFSLVLLLGCQSAPKADEQPLAPLLERIGNLHFPVRTDDPMAQKYFDQGLSLVYGFNHLEGERSFREAARRDPKLAMAWWGVALALAPNINDPLPDADREKNAWEAIGKARELSSGTNEKERAMIEALAARHSGEPEPDRAALNKAYADKMTALVAQYPEDADIQTLYADAVMNTMPWDYWIDGGRTPKPETEPALAALEKAIALNLNHPGANHLYIHAIEASTDPDKAVPAAERLGDLIPVAGHLVHMPGHIWIRVGRYEDAVDANRKAIVADEDYVSQCRAQGIYPVGYYPHNIHFLHAALMMRGQGKEAMEAARKVASKHHAEHFQAMPNFGFGHLLRALPMLTMVRFGYWDQAMAEPEPSQDMVYARACWRFARGMAQTAKGDLAAADAELKAMEELAADPTLAEMKIFDLNALDSMARMGVLNLRAHVQAARKDYAGAEASLREAIAIEDGLLYSEPPDWPLPPRHALGMILLEANRYPAAAQAFREDLARHRNNGWSLHGLERALVAQGKKDEAAQIKASFAEAWKDADLDLP
jgi:tetratricopeptide (TPR) repeat protein